MNNPDTGNTEYCVLDEDYTCVLVKGTTCSDFIVYIYETFLLLLFIIIIIFFFFFFF